MAAEIEQSLFSIQDIEGKGKGLVATQLILKGTRILCEKPLIRFLDKNFENPALAAAVCRKVELLTAVDREKFLSLRNIHDYGNVQEQYIGIIKTNGLPTDEDIPEAGIFEFSCRINHACDNNAQKSWNANIGRHTIHALRDITKGEEITIFYLGTLTPRDRRQGDLQAKFRFECACRLCCLDTKKSRQSDLRLAAVLRLERLINQGGLGGVLETPLQMLRYVDEQVRLYEQHGPGDAGLPRAFFDAAQIVLAHGDLARGKIFAEKAKAEWIRVGGGDSMQVLRYGKLGLDPAKFILYGKTMQWKTDIDQVPNDLDSTSFEDWLWRRKSAAKKDREKRKRAKKMSSTDRAKKLDLG